MLFMRLRALLALLLVVAFLVLAFFVLISAYSFWGDYPELLAQKIPIGEAFISVLTLVIAHTALLLTLAALALMLVYLVMDRVFITPIKEISRSMGTFIKSSKFSPLPPIALTTTEIRELVGSYVGFTQGVEEVHERDMEISRVKSDFISTAAHQLRTPLTGIRWALEALAKQPLNADQKILVDDAANKSRDLVAIVGMLLDISSIESGKHKYIFIQDSVEDLVALVVNDFQRQASESSVSLVFTLPEGKLPHARFDRDQIKWVLNNLLENAIRYTPAGGNVTVSMATTANRLIIKVRDTGIGITTKDRSSIFERFYRADNAIAKENKGNGLGLYIARTIASDHGGDLAFAANENGVGTTFTLSLPRAHREVHHKV